MSTSQDAALSSVARLRDACPIFAAELHRLLAASEMPELEAQVDDLQITGRCRCGDDFCSTMHTAGGRSPIALGEEIPCPYWRDSIDLDAEAGMVIIDIDQFHRIVCIEVLFRPDVDAELAVAFPRAEPATVYDGLDA